MNEKAKRQKDLSSFDRRAHWNHVYSTKREDEVSWFQPEATPSLELVARCGLGAGARVVDVGGGASRLVDALLDRGLAPTVLDLSEAALEASRARLGDRASRVEWIAGDVTAFAPRAPFELWHDRAVFHFLTDAGDRAAYVRAMERSIASGGHAIVATFALDGPERCSGLDVVRYDGASLAAALGPSFRLVESLRHEHVTPAGRAQAFTFARFAR